MYTLRFTCDTHKTRNVNILSTELSANYEYKRPFIHVFSAFHISHVAKIGRYWWKRQLKISKLAKYVSRILQSRKVLGSQSRKI